jgi:hypothetical protein
MEKKIVYSIKEAQDIISLIELIPNPPVVDLAVEVDGVPFYYDFEKKCLVSGTKPTSVIKPDWIPTKENYYYYDFDYCGPRSGNYDTSSDEFRKRIAIGNCFKHPKDMTAKSLNNILKNLIQYHKLNGFGPIK